MNTTNRLAQESSPYLRQHAYNPVEWYPWSEEALQKARQENKPILLSIGYAACHWCHVMAHESFEDAETAKLMNDLFINIKVDKEERPDLDKIYQTTHYLLTRRNGGWPLTVFLTPKDLTPFFSGTYFPKEARYQLPAFKDLLKAIAEAYHQQKGDIEKQNQELVAFLNQPVPSNAHQTLSDAPIKDAISALQAVYDPLYGGFGEAPKFPQPMKLEFLFKEHSEMAQATLNHMAAGGIYDQLAGGFFRYSVDNKWEIPHFEKMLYDNGQLLYIYALANNREKIAYLREAQIDHKQSMPRKAREARLSGVTETTGRFIQNTMQAAQGGYYSSIDADSEGKEGKYYLWTDAECQEVLSKDEYKVLKIHFGLDKPPNMEDHYWHFNISKNAEAIAEALAMPLAQVNQLIAAGKKKLLNTRMQRVAPDFDKKVLTAWNGLMIKGMLLASQCTEQSSLRESAYQALQYIIKHYRENKALLAVYPAQNHKQITAYLDDYAFLIDALLCALQINWDTELFNLCLSLSDELIDSFYDEVHGGFFFTPKQHEKLLYRPKTMMDEATPSGNGVATRVLSILGFMTGRQHYLNVVEKTLQQAFSSLSRYPSEHCTMLLGLKTFLSPPEIVIIRSTPERLDELRQQYSKLDNYVFAIPNDAVDLPEGLIEKTPKSETTIYVCQGTQCKEV